MLACQTLTVYGHEGDSTEADVAITEGNAVDALDLDEALTDLAKVDERQAQVVELRFYGGLTIEQVAESLDDHGDEPPPVPPIRFDQPDEQFDLVLAWEHFDFIPPNRLPDFADEVARVLRDGGWLFLFSQMATPSGPEQPSRFRLLADDMIVREPSGVPARRRWANSTRDIERALKAFSIEGVQLQRNQMREFSAVKV